MNIIELAKNTILQESESIRKLAGYIDQDFEKTVKYIENQGVTG